MTKQTAERKFIRLSYMKNIDRKMQECVVGFAPYINEEQETYNNRFDIFLKHLKLYILNELRTIEDIKKIQMFLLVAGYGLSNVLITNVEVIKE